MKQKNNLPPRGFWLLTCSRSKLNPDEQVMKGDWIRGKKDGNLSNLYVHILTVRFPLYYMWFSSLNAISTLKGGEKSTQMHAVF